MKHDDSGVSRNEALVQLLEWGLEHADQKEAEPTLLQIGNSRPRASKR